MADTRANRIQRSLDTLFTDLSEKYGLSEAEVGCAMLVVRSIGKHTLDPEAAGKEIRAMLANGPYSFSYAGRDFTVTPEEFDRYTPQPDVSSRLYALFHAIHRVPDPDRMGGRSSDEKEEAASAIFSAVVRYARS